MNSVDLKRILRFMKYRKTYREYLLFSFLLETNLTLTEILELKVEDVIGKQCYVDQKKNQHFLPTYLTTDIYAYCEFSQGEHYLFAGKTNNALSRTQAWNMIKKTFEECGFGQAYSTISTLRTQYKGDMNDHEK